MKRDAKPMVRHAHPPMADECGGFVLLNVFDLFLSALIFGHGGHEMNPLGAHVLGRYGLTGFTYYKFSVAAFVLCGIEVMGRHRPDVARRLMQATNLLYFAVVLWECALLWGL